MNENQKVQLTEKQKILFTSMRGVWFDIVTYLPKIEITELLDSLNPLSYAFCLHDKDVYDKDIIDINGEVLHKKGDLKKAHYHIVLCFHSRRRASRLVRLFNTTQIRVIEVDYQLKGSYDYLTHENEKDKVKYEKSSLVVHNQAFFDNYNYTESAKDNSLEIVNKIINRYSMRELVRTYGRDFVIHYRNYHDVAMAICSEERHTNHFGIVDDEEEKMLDKVL